MFCPTCATSQPEDLKFCTSCGANLFAVRKALASRDTNEKFDWSKTWVAEIMLSHEEREKRKLEQARGETAELKRYKEIKDGVITSSVGAGVMVFLYVLFQGIIASGKIPPDVVPILRVIWVAGVIPFFVGLGLVFNGLIVSKKQVEFARRELKADHGRKTLSGAAKETDPSLPTAEWSEPPEFGVTENTTRELS